MTVTPLADRIGDIFVRHLHIEHPPLDHDLIESGTVDSLTLVELIAHLEQEFSIQISLGDLDLEHFRSIRHIEGFIEKLLSESEVSLAHSRVSQ